MTVIADNLITRILYPLRDAAQDMFVDAELLDYMNAAIVDLCARERLFRDVATIPTSGGALAMTDDMLQIRWARTPDGVEVGWLDESTFFEYQITYPDWDSDTPLATVYSDAIWLHPAPDDAESWTVGYYGVPDKMSTTTDVFPLRVLYEEKVVRWARAQCWYRIGEMALADRDMAFYEEGMRPSEAGTDRQVPGRLNFAREPNVFDAEPTSIHQGG